MTSSGSVSSERPLSGTLIYFFSIHLLRDARYLGSHLNKVNKVII